MSTDLTVAKQRLAERLGPNYGIYLQLLSRWFRGSISKDEFDRKAKQLIENNILEHNKFWLTFFHHCADRTSNCFKMADDRPQEKSKEDGIGDSSNIIFDSGPKVRCLPNRLITHMRTFVIAWEIGLESVNDDVSVYINLALRHFLKNIITELVCTRTAYRLRENRFRYAIGVKPMNPYLNNSLKIYSCNLEYDPYQIESNKMNSSLVDTYIYNDSLFSSRLYESQALYEFACSTTTVNDEQRTKRLKLSKRLTMEHLLIAFILNRTIIPAQSLYSVNLERIFCKLSNQ